MKNIGTISWGVKAPIIRPGDDLVEITADSVMKAVKEAKIKLKDRDIVAVTEAIVAKSQGNFATVDDIAKDVRAKWEKAPLVLLTQFFQETDFQIF